ncbi:hypothetical protein [Kocuria sabuli]|uniref:hypothetical protein n=1 Tax=Kocuria sabuli TaxID=3071448 RepID=UPI0034D53632
MIAYIGRAEQGELSVYQEPRKMGRSKLPHQQKLHIWAEAAIPILQEVATGDDGYITYGDLARLVVERTGRSTTMETRLWIGKVLGMVLQRCRKRGLPVLPSLVVQADTGMVGMGFNYWLELTEQEPQQDQHALDFIAAIERTKCFNTYGHPSRGAAGPTRTPLYKKKQCRSG